MTAALSRISLVLTVVHVRPLPRSRLARPARAAPAAHQSLGRGAAAQVALLAFITLVCPWALVRIQHLKHRINGRVVAPLAPAPDAAAGSERGWRRSPFASTSRQAVG